MRYRSAPLICIGCGASAWKQETFFGVQGHSSTGSECTAKNCRRPACRAIHVNLAKPITPERLQQINAQRMELCKAAGNTFHPYTNQEDWYNLKIK
jgi:hypothetical protein